MVSLLLNGTFLLILPKGGKVGYGVKINNLNHVTTGIDIVDFQS